MTACEAAQFEAGDSGRELEVAQIINTCSRGQDWVLQVHAAVGQL